MTKFKFRTCLILSVLMAISLIFGIGAFAFAAEGTSENAVDGNGWNTKVTRGDALVEAGHREDAEYYTTYTDLQSGDVIKYASSLKTKKVDYLVRTTPIRFDISAKGEGSVMWTLNADSTTGERKIVFGGITDIGGTALRNAVGINTYGVNVPVVQEGKNLSIVFEGLHLYGGTIFYDLGNGFNKLGATEIKFDQPDTEGSETVWTPEDFYLEITVSGKVDEITVKAGEGDLFTKADGNWAWPGYQDGFKPTGVFEKGILQAANAQPDVAHFLAFKGYPVTFSVSQGDAATPNAYVTIGGVRVDSDATAAGYLELGKYNYLIPRDAEDFSLKVCAADFAVTYQYKEEKLLDAYLKKGDKAYDKNFAIRGEKIVGWFTDEALQNPFDFNTVINESITLYAKTEKSLVVSFTDAEGTDYGFENVEANGTVSRPSDPTKDGMTFVDWYSDTEGKNVFDFTAPITQDTTVYALFGYNVTFRVLGFDDAAQAAVVPVVVGGYLKEENIPTFGKITGYPDFTTIKLGWYTDATMKTPVEFGGDGVQINKPVTYVAAVLDNDTAKNYVSPNEGGWDRNASGEKDAAGNMLTANSQMAQNIKYGSMEAMTTEDGSSKINLNYVGYIAGCRGFDASKDIFLTYTLDSKNESANDEDGPKHHMKEFFIGMFNSQTGALINQGQMHLNRFGAFAVFGHKINTDSQNSPSDGNKRLKYPLANQGAATNEFVYEEAKQVQLKISVGDTNTVIYQLQGGEWVDVGTLNVTRAMFPNGVYLALETTRITWMEMEATQISSITQGAVNGGTFEITTAEALEGKLYAGDRVYFNATANEGFVFTDQGVFANGVRLDVRQDEDKRYYFNMPFGVNEITVGFGLTVTFKADGVQTQTLDIVAGTCIDEFYVDDAPVKTGYVFSGWCTDEACTQIFDFENTPVTAPITLYAKYDAATYTITFMDGTSRYKTATAVFGEKYSEPEKPVKEGFAFEGWYSDSACTQKYDFSTTVSGNVTVYAKWTAVKEEPKGGCSGSVVTGTAVAGILVLAAACAVMRKKAK